MNPERRTLLKSGLALAGAAASAFLHPARAATETSPALANRLDTLAGRLRGKVILPRDPDYAFFSQLWNAQYAAVLPAAVIVAADENDVAQAVVFAGEEGIDFVVRSGGHSFAGYSTTPGLVIDLRRLTRKSRSTAKTRRRPSERA